MDLFDAKLSPRALVPLALAIPVDRPGPPKAKREHGEPTTLDLAGAGDKRDPKGSTESGTFFYL
ncbi:hypothetical protein G6O69_08580 [Pseudenhygromyxa sp. WMMC2535]|uniref:hypothetical protein n=1 Tax=Pseudenhygromyxa sp. WMMC2535 TaxID=2712867 RepID=UPI001555FA07|nr:hypothetical protein [Pseudenhygromyxa sp. WMMC2535]NVB37888.1 hypothetical protein [Pseudenhygromyxa sp. WMMC2535]